MGSQHTGSHPRKLDKGSESFRTGRQRGNWPTGHRTLFFGESEFAFGPVILHRFLGIKDGEMFAEDFFARVALDGSRAGVPGEDVAVGVEDEDGVVLHGVNEESKSDVRLDGFVSGGRCLLDWSGQSIVLPKPRQRWGTAPVAS